MKKWIPQVKKPFNPSYRPVWDQMSARERQISWLVDLAVLIAGVSAVLYFGM